MTEAVKVMLAKRVLPTSLDSAGIRALDAALRRQSLTSAKTTNQYLLGRYQELITSILNPTKDERGVNVGYNPATAREAIRRFLISVNYLPAEEDAGTIKDLSSDARINLVINTNRDMALGAGAYIKGTDADVVDEYPAWEFVRFEDRNEPRNWTGMNGLWENACRRAGDLDALRVYGATGRMIAVKSSKVWDEISNSDYTPGGLDQPFDPVAFGTGMWREDVSRKECEEVGLLDPGEQVEAPELSLADFFSE